MPGHGNDGLELSSLQDLYQQVILDHYRRPRNKGPLEGATHTLTLNNPLCGDVIDLMLRLEGDRIDEVHFEGKGCSISQASASMMGSVLKGRTIQEALAVMETFTRMLRHGRGRRHRPWRPACAGGRGEVPGAREMRATRVELPGRNGRPRGHALVTLPSA
jgi:SUF system NifU family Fe-S assembly protein